MAYSPQLILKRPVVVSVSVVQRAVGAAPMDEVFGPRVAAAILRVIQDVVAARVRVQKGISEFPGTTWLKSSPLATSVKGPRQFGAVAAASVSPRGES